MRELMRQVCSLMYCSESAVVLTREESVVVARCMHDEEEFPSVRALCSAAAAANFCSDTLAAPSACDLPNAPIQHPNLISHLRVQKNRSHATTTRNI